MILIDVEHHRLPNSLTLSTYVVVVATLAITATLEQEWPTFGRAIVGGFVLALIYAALATAFPRGMGWGDEIGIGAGHRRWPGWAGVLLVVRRIRGLLARGGMGCRLHPQLAGRDAKRFAVQAVHGGSRSAPGLGSAVAWYPICSSDDLGLNKVVLPDATRWTRIYGGHGGKEQWEWRADPRLFVCNCVSRSRSWLVIEHLNSIGEIPASWQGRRSRRRGVSVRPSDTWSKSAGPVARMSDSGQRMVARQVGSTPGAAKEFAKLCLCPVGDMLPMLVQDCVL